jgi:molecular chaperone GrpE
MSNEILDQKPDETPKTASPVAGAADGKAMSESDLESSVAPLAAETAPAPANITAEDIEQWKVKAAKADEYYDRLLRQAAEFDNYKKRAAREKQDAIKYANMALLEKLVSVMDHFEMALAASASPQPDTNDSFKKGIDMIFNQIKTVASEGGIEEINALNQRFDPNLHEAVSMQESAEFPEDHVIVQLRKGYKLKDRLLRPATVVIAKKPATT